MAILRRGSSALTHSDDGMDLARFRAASLQEILDVSRARNDVHEARVKHKLNIEVGGAEEALLRSAEEEEKELLSGVARVQSYLFEGTVGAHEGAEGGWAVCDAAEEARAGGPYCEHWRDGIYCR
jgi:SWI/SNF-related matrix-associated actin-dependent regulator of chromatin subfamily A member 5